MVSRRSECETIVRWLWPYLDQRLPESERDRVTHHLEQCEDCLSHFDFAWAFLEAVHAAHPAADPDIALRARVLSALNDQGLKL